MKKVGYPNVFHLYITDINEKLYFLATKPICNIFIVFLKNQEFLSPTKPCIMA